MTDELPAAGGSYTREADGSLRRNSDLAPSEAPETAAKQPVKGS